MKKLLVTTVFALVLLGATVPGYMGWETHKQMDALAEYIDGMPGYSAKWLDYQRGWFNSHGRMAVTIDQPQLSAGALTLPVDFHLKHGPVLTGVGRWQLGWFDLVVHLTQDNEAYLQQHLSVQGDGPIYELAAVMALDGTTALADRWLAAQLTMEDAIIKTQGYNGNGVIGLDRVLHYNGMLQPIDLSGDSGSATLGAVEFEVVAELARATDIYVVPFKMLMSAESLNLRSTMPDTLGQWQFGELSINTTTDIDQHDLVHSTTLLQVASMTSTDTPALSEVSLGLAYKRIPLAFIAAYQKLAEQAPDEAGPEYWQAAMGSLVIEQLLPASPEFEVSPVTFSTEQGNGRMSLSIGVDGEAIAGADVSPQNPLGIMPFIKADLDLDLTQALLEQLVEIYAKQTLTEQLAQQELAMTEAEFAEALEAQKLSIIEMLRLQGLLVTDGEQSSLQFSLAKGQATLNGRPLPLPF